MHIEPGLKENLPETGTKYCGHSYEEISNPKQLVLAAKTQDTENN